MIRKSELSRQLASYMTKEQLLKSWLASINVSMTEEERKQFMLLGTEDRKKHIKKFITSAAGK